MGLQFSTPAPRATPPLSAADAHAQGLWQKLQASRTAFLLQPSQLLLESYLRRAHAFHLAYADGDPTEANKQVRLLRPILAGILADHLKKRAGA